MRREEGTEKNLALTANRRSDNQKSRAYLSSCSCLVCHMSKNAKWKSGLLKTGLPLEYVTARILSEKGHSIFGEYPYIRPNESGELREFSVDLRTWKWFDSQSDFTGGLSILVECKYRQPGTKWIFAPLPGEAYPIGLVNSTEDLVPVRLHNSEAIWNVEKNLGYCVGGIELSKDGSGVASRVRHGVFQLRYAMPPLLRHELENAYKYAWFKGHHIDLLFPMLVTTAELRLLKKGLELDDFKNANEISELTDVRDALVLNERPGPQLQEFADEHARDFIVAHPKLETRLDALSQVLVGPKYENRAAPNLESIERSFGFSTERILVVTYDALDRVLTRISDAIDENLKSATIYGSYQDDVDLTLLAADGTTIANDI